MPTLLDELELALVLEHLEQLHGVPVVGHEAAHLLDHILHELGVLGEVPALLAMHRLATLAFVEARCLGVELGHSCCSNGSWDRKIM